MRKVFLIASLLFLTGTLKLTAQELIVTTPDTVKIIAPPVMDSSFYLKSILGIMSEPGDGGARVTLSQSAGMERAVNAHLQAAGSRKLNGYRVRIFFGNKQNARSRSQEVMNGFLSRYNSVRAYWNHESPFFKVTVGDFRTKSEAMRLLREISSEYPSGFVVRESINFPPL